MIRNDDNEVKCFTEKGDIRWLAEHIANDANLMKSMDLKVAHSPRKLEPIIEEDLQVAEAVVADKPRKQKTK